MAIITLNINSKQAFIWLVHKLELGILPFREPFWVLLLLNQNNVFNFFLHIKITTIFKRIFFIFRRAVIVAGGTMAPMDEFKNQLFLAAGAEPDRVLGFSCTHVVPESNILPLVMTKGPGNSLMDFTFKNRCNTALVFIFFLISRKIRCQK